MIPAPPPGASADLPPPPGDPADGLEVRPRVPWGWPEAIVIYLVGYLVIANLFVGGIVFAIGGVDDPDAGGGVVGLVATLVADVAFVVLAVAWLNARHPGWAASLGVPPVGRRLRALARGAGWGILLYPVMAIAVGVPLTFLFEALSGEPTTTPDQLPADLSAGGTALAIVVAVVIAPVTEEFLYRGIVFRSIRDRSGFWVGALASSVLFGVVHYVPAPWHDTVLLQSVMVFTGFGFAWIYERERTILASIAAHVMFNVIGVTLILSGAA